MKKLLIIFICLAVSFSLFAQSKNYQYDSINRTEKYLYANGSLYYEIVQLDKIPDKHRHFIFYSINGQKTQEFYDRDKVIYDTLRKWTDEGKLYHQEAYTTKGYLSIDYWVETGKISDLGTYEITKKVPKLEIYDSIKGITYTSKFCRSDQPCYIRAGIWKQYHKNGVLASEGKYLPWSFIILIRGAKEDENNPGVLSAYGENYLKDGTWNYYDDKGKLTKTEVYKSGLLMNEK